MNEHVRRLHETLQRLLGFGLLQVKHNRTLVSVDIEKERAHSRAAMGTDEPGVVAFRRFDLDHVRAHVAQNLVRRPARVH